MSIFSKIKLSLYQRFLVLLHASRLVWITTPRLTVLTFILVLIQSLFPLGILYVTKLTIDAVTIATQLEIRGLDQVIPYIMLLGVILLLQQVLDTVMTLVSRWQSRIMTDKIVSQIHARTILADLEYFESPDYHDMRQMAQQEGPRRPQQVINSLIMLLKSVISLGAVIVLVMVLNWGLGLLLVATAIPGLLVKLHYARVTYQWQRESVALRRKQSYHGWVLTLEWFVKEVRLFRLGNLFRERYDTITTQLRQKELMIESRQSGAELLSNLLSTFAFILAMVYVSQQAILNTITIGGFIMYFQAFQQGQTLLRQALSGLASLHEHSIFLGAFYDFMALQPKIISPSMPITAPIVIEGTGITLQDVSFRYPGAAAPILENINMIIRPGEVVALVGNNGAGKSTLVKLLCRLYDPISGRISVNNVALRELDPAEWRKQISVVFQDYVKYPLTAWENIWLGNVDHPVDQQRIRKAGIFAGIDEALSEFEQGYNTPLTNWFEGGKELSQGQWQKMAVARAFYRDAPFIILDEPSSSLDILTEDTIFRQFTQLTKNKSVLLISHRMSTVRMADRIYVLKDAHIVESGTHEELLALKGTYAYLFETQAQHYQPQKQSSSGFADKDEISFDQRLQKGF